MTLTTAQIGEAGPTTQFLPNQKVVALIAFAFSLCVSDGVDVECPTTTDGPRWRQRNWYTPAEFNEESVFIPP